MMRFKPAKFLANGHLQTLYAGLFSKPSTPLVEWEIVELPDGDFVECVWHQKPKMGENRPIMILFHGLAGGFDSPYIKRAMHALGAKGFAVVLMHFRGCGRTMNRLPRAYHSGDTADAKYLIAHLKETYHDSPLFATGYSLGGNMLLKLLGEMREDSLLDGAMVVSAPMQLESAANRIKRGFSKLYQYNMMRALRASLREKYRYHDMEKLLQLGEEEVNQINNFWEFDNRYTAPIHGFKDAKEYYEKSSSKQYLKYITTPTLIIHAKDDPFLGEGVIPSHEELSSSITFELYESGGHVGFVAGSVLQPEYWIERRMLDFFATIRPL